MVEWPNCMTDGIKAHIKLKRGILLIKNKKEVQYYCPVCEWAIIRVFDLSRDDYDFEIAKRREILNKIKGGNQDGNN